MVEVEEQKRINRNARRIDLVSGTLAGLCILGAAGKAIHDWPEKQDRYEGSNGVVMVSENPAYRLEQRISFTEGTIGLGVSLIIAAGGIVIRELYKDFAEGVFSQPDYT